MTVEFKDRDDEAMAEEEPARFAHAIFKALEFAADKHRDQRRKGSEASPYINHPIQVANVLTSVGGIHNLNNFA